MINGCWLMMSDQFSVSTFVILSYEPPALFHLIWVALVQS